MKLRLPRWSRLPRPGALGGVVAILAGTLLFLLVVFPYLAQAIAGSKNPLPVPSTLLIWYVVLVVASLGVYITSSNDTTRAFVSPIVETVRGRRPRWQQVLLLVTSALLPLLLGMLVFRTLLPESAPPPAIRQQHPGMSSSNAAPYVGARNRFREMGQSERNAALATGRGLYFLNCAPCHGGKHDGDGPAAPALGLRPVSFRDPGTIATLVEDAVFWRVNEGNVGLPPSATPWDSAMPGWRGDLTADEIWQVILSEYADASVEPRSTEAE